MYIFASSDISSVYFMEGLLCASASIVELMNIEPSSTLNGAAIENRLDERDLLAMG